MNRIKELYAAFSSRERVFLLFAALCGFFISADYAVIRPAGQSIFLRFFGSEMLPYVWLAAVPLNLFLVTLHNRFLPRLGPGTVFAVTVGSVTVVNSLCALYIDTVPWVSFAFYLWKEVYVLLFFQQVWAVIHATVSLDRARYLYGVLFGLGALGAFFGSLIPGFLAVRFGSADLLFCTLPFCLCLMLSYRGLLAKSLQKQSSGEKGEFSLQDTTRSIRLIRNSVLLKAIVGMTVCMQIAATFADFQFQALLVKAFPDTDLRTECFGRIVSGGNLLTMSLQFVGTFLCIRYFGLRNTHLLVPSVLLLGLVTVMVTGAFGSVAFFFVILKAFEFSLFLVIKEMLYIPMRAEEKFRAKAVIDVFFSRFAKVGASCAILTAGYFVGEKAPSYVPLCLLPVLLFWAGIVIRSGKQYPERSNI